MNKKVLIVGSGGREHALAWKLNQSEQVSQVFVAPGNDAMKAHAEVCAVTTHEAILELVKEHAIDLTVIGQEVYLVNGLADELRAQGYAVAGPSAAAAALEGSKAFAKTFMHKHNIPTASYESFSEVTPALEYLDTMSAPWVIKADGLAAGKGVLICDNKEEAIEGIQNILGGQFGEAGHSLIIESFLKGEEASCFVLSDGNDFVLFPFVQDHKRIGELDTGLNTGGMGAYSPAPVVTPEVREYVLDNIVAPTISGMKEDGIPYCGILYIGLMIHEGEAQVVEYNCRFGDPECQPLMMQLGSDLFPLMMASAEGILLKQVAPQWLNQAAVCVVLASEGYPEAYEKGKIISGIDASHIGGDGVMSCIFHSGTCLDGNVFRTNGGRVLGVTTLGNTHEEALQNAYDLAQTVYWEGVIYRRDIALKGMLALRDQRPEVSVGIIMGSASDFAIAKKTTDILEQFGVGYEVCVASAHRSPERVQHFVQTAESKGAETFIAIAGMAAHLPGVVASGTARPVIGVPVRATMDGWDALLSIAQMPLGVPVATVAINGGANAALLAIQILAIHYTDLRAALKLYKLKMEQKVIQSHESVITNAKLNS